jgi:hypothetical protein
VGAVVVTTAAGRLTSLIHPIDKVLSVLGITRNALDGVHNP